MTGIETATNLVTLASAGHVVGIKDILDDPAFDPAHLPKLKYSDVPDTLLNGHPEFFQLASLHGENEIASPGLYIAAYFKHADIVEAMIEKKLYDQKSLDIALVAAAMSRENALLESLIKAGADRSLAEHKALFHALSHNNNEAIARLSQGEEDTSALLKNYIRSGHIDKIREILLQNPPLLPAMKVIADLTSDRGTLEKDIDYQTGLRILDLLVSHAKNTEQDQPAFWHAVMKEAIRLWTSPLIEKIIGIEDFYTHPDYRDILTNAAVRSARSAYSQYDLRYKDHLQLCRRMIALGANPQAVLEAAAERGSYDMCVLALSHHADPRFGSVLQDVPSPTQTILKQAEKYRDDEIATVHKAMEEAANALELQDLEAYRQLQALCPEPTIDDILAIDPVTKKSRLMLAIIAGDTDKAFSVFTNSGLTPSPAQILESASNGFSVYDVLDAKKETQKLFNPRLWRANKESLTEFLDKLPKKHHKIHAEDISMLQMDVGADALTKKVHTKPSRFRIVR